MRQITVYIFILTFSFPYFGGNLFSQEEWSLRRQKEDITIHTRTRQDSPLKEYRIRATINAPIMVVYEFLSNVNLHPQWVYQCSGLTVLDEEKGRYIIYHTSYDIPWPVQDRDLVAKALITWEKDSSMARILTEEVNLDYKVLKDVVRMPDYREDVLLEDIEGGRTIFRVEGFADPGGKIPPWLVNMFMVDGIYESVISTREWTEK